MSHFSTIKTKIRNLETLQSALSDLGIDWQSGPRPVRGYNQQTRTAALIIEQDNEFDIGFHWNGQEYELVADLQYWQQPLTVDGFLRQVTQRYAYRTILEEANNKGFELAEQTENSDGSVRLVVQRWSA
ncbi:MAG: DUF1257 domain-containing protein [Cyanobacteria bacterium P01_H01_bin.15]